MQIAILDYGLGNLLSLSRALSKLGQPNSIVTTLHSADLEDIVILPGVGAFPEAMSNLNRLGLSQQLRDRAASDGPILGICLGMQLLFESSTEGGSSTRGLSIIPGRVERIPDSEPPSTYRVPHVGWSKVKVNYSGQTSPTITPALDNTEFYFTHSFRATPKNPNTVIGEVDLGNMAFAVAVGLRNTIGFQFHPEKSGVNGMALLSAAIELFQKDGKS